MIIHRGVVYCLADRKESVLVHEKDDPSKYYDISTYDVEGPLGPGAYLLYFGLPKELRGRGKGAEYYQRWENRLPKLDRIYLHATSIDTARFWKKQGYEFVYEEPITDTDARFLMAKEFVQKKAPISFDQDQYEKIDWLVGPEKEEYIPRAAQMYTYFENERNRRKREWLKLKNQLKRSRDKGGPPREEVSQQAGVDVPP
jgi:hypothetical protein